MSELEFIAERLREHAAQFEEDPGYYQWVSHIKEAVAGCILHAYKLGRLNEIEHLDLAVSDYRDRTKGILDEDRKKDSGSGADIALVEFFDHVVGYDHIRHKVGIIGSAATFLPRTLYQFTYVEDVGKAWSAACKFLALLCTSPPVDPVLIENDRLILQAMLELDAVSTNVQKSLDIMKKAGVEAEPNHAFDSLKDNGLVASKQGVGRYLTDRGLELAQRLFGERK